MTRTPMKNAGEVQASGGLSAADHLLASVDGLARLANPDEVMEWITTGKSLAFTADGRAAAVAQIVAFGDFYQDGTTISDGTVTYVKSSGATEIPDMPGWLPFGVWKPAHFGAAGQILYVDPAGSDSNGGFSSGDAFQTIQAASDYLRNFFPLDGVCEIRLAAGTYTEGVVFNGMNQGPEIRVVGDTKANTIIDGATALNLFGINCNGGGRYRIRNLTVRNFASNGIAFQNETIGVIDTCNVEDCGDFGMNASDGCQMKIIGACRVLVPIGGDGIRYYHNSQGTVGDGVNPIVVDGQGNNCDGIVIRNGSEVVCADNLTVTNCQTTGLWVFRSSFVELRTTTLSNNNIALNVAANSSFADAGETAGGAASVTYSGNAVNQRFTGFSVDWNDGVATLRADDGASAATPSSNYQLVLENDGSVAGIQALASFLNIDANKTDRISIDAASHRMTLVLNSANSYRFNPASFIPIADGSTSLGASGFGWSRVYYAGGVFDGSGAGSPEGVITAPVGSTWRRTDGGAGTTFYVKEIGTGNTGWAAK